MNIMEKEHCNIRVIIIMVVCRFPGSIMTIPSGTMFFFWCVLNVSTTWYKSTSSFSFQGILYFMYSQVLTCVYTERCGRLTRRKQFCGLQVSFALRRSVTLFNFI